MKKKYQIKVYKFYFDLENLEEIKSCINKIAALKIKIDILVNNAGIASGSFFQMTPMRDLEKMLQINFTSQIYFTQGISRLMAKNKIGSIINVASTAGLLGDIGTLSYGSSKAALIFATKTIAAELGVFNIRVNAVAPSVTKTDMFHQMDDKSRENLIQSSILKRACEPIEVANVVLFLASDMSSFVNAQTIRVDGGFIN